MTYFSRLILTIYDRGWFFFRMSFQKVKRISIRSAFFDSTKLWKVFHNMFDKRVNISFFTSRYLYIEDWNNWIRAKKEKKFKSLNQTRVGRSCSLLISSECLISYLESLLLVLWVFFIRNRQIRNYFSNIRGDWTMFEVGQWANERGHDLSEEERTEINQTN